MRSSTSDPTNAYEAFLEVTQDSVWTGHVRNLPGCVAFGTTRDATLDALAGDVIACYRWLRSHGEPVCVPNKRPRLRVTETVRDVSPARQSGEAVALFRADREPATDDLIDRVLQLLRYCQADFEQLAGNQPAGVLNHRLGPENRSANEILRHTGQAECWYLTRLEPKDDPEIAALYQRLTTEEPLSGLRAVLATAERRFQQWSPAQRSACFTPQHNSRYGTEQWSARKVLRRFVEHRREHLDELSRTILDARA